MRRERTVVLVLALLVVLIGTGCGRDEDKSGLDGGNGESIGLKVDYPLEGSVFPPDFAPPTFLWHDDTPGVDHFQLRVTFADGGDPVLSESSGPPPPRGEIDPRCIGPANKSYEPTEYQRTARSWSPNLAEWATMKTRSVNVPATLTIEGLARDKPKEVRSDGQVTFSTSSDPVGAPIFYRDVPLMPSEGKDGTIRPLAQSAIPLIAWRLRDISRPDSKVVLTEMPSCANCHSFSTDGSTLGMDVDGPTGDKGTYAIAPLSKETVITSEEIITWNSYPDKYEGHKTIGFLSRISPDGSMALTTVNESIYGANFTDFRFLQVFFPTRGTLAWYSTESGEMAALPGADDPDYVQCSPVWFPDGEEIVFARAKACEPYPEGQPRATYAGDPNELRVQYDLYRMPFNGGKGGTPVPIEGASNNGMSNTFPKISPDGKWLVYTKCENGLLMRPDGRLWIVNLETGKAREMTCNTSLMNSWHSFSPNGRWMVFSSKANTPYTQMFLTHIDLEGNDTPPILIENSTAANRAVNIPEFVNRTFDSLDTIEVPAVKHHDEVNQGIKLAGQGRHAEAVVQFEQALTRDPGFSRALAALGASLLELGRTEEAREKLTLAVEIAPDSVQARVNLGDLYMREDRIDDAAEQFELATQSAARNLLAEYNLGLARFHQGRLRDARRHLRIAAELEPENADVRNALGGTLERLGEPEEAILEYRAALECNRDHPDALGNLAIALRRHGDSTEALELLKRAVEATPTDTVLRSALCDLLLERGLSAEALTHTEELLRAAPEDPAVQIRMAWLLATLPDDSLRDGLRAVRLAERCRDGSGENANTLDVLGAAYAEAGRFPEAVKAAGRALELGGDVEGATMPGLADRLAGYRERRPHRQ